MEKQQIQAKLVETLTRMGITFAQEKESDLEIHTEFVNESWSSGRKKFRYDAFIRLNEEEKTVYLWQKTTETGAGLLFGCGLETTTQTGAASFRKVKLLQYGPEGKVVELNANLGEIAKAVKTAAKQNGWKFHTALRQDKAKYR